LSRYCYLKAATALYTATGDDTLLSTDSQDSGYSADAKINLLRLGLGEGVSMSSGCDEDRLDLLCDILKSPLPVPHEVKEALPAVFQGPGTRLKSLAGDPILECLLNGETKSATLRAIKEYARQQGREAQSEWVREVFLAVYCMAIAAAVVFHGEIISQHSAHDLGAFFFKYSESSWIPLKLRQLLARAAKTMSESDDGSQ